MRGEMEARQAKREKPTMAETRQEEKKSLRLAEREEKSRPEVREEVRQGIRLGLPVLIGYFSASVPFGLLAKAGGIPLLEAFLFSALVFAGASQFMAINLLQAGVAAGEIILATFLVNCRHLVMSTVLAARLREKGPGKPLTFLTAFGVTDETFALAATRKEGLTPHFLLSLEVTAYSGWLAGTVTGFLLGAALPAKARASMGIALYAMFAAILTPDLKKSRSALFLAAGAGIFHTVLGRLQLFSPGWNLILAIVLTAAAGSYFSGEKRGNN